MNDRALTQQHKTATPISTPVRSNVLQRKCACGGTPGPTGECAACRRKRLGIQPKLTINQPGDKYEREADRVADQVMRLPEPRLQRQAGLDEEEEEKLLQTKPLVQRQVTGQTHAGIVPPIVQEVLNSPGQPLDPATRDFMEPRFGHDFSRVRVYHIARDDQSRQARQSLKRQVAEESGLSYDFQREHFCLNEPNPSNPTRKSFTPQEMPRVVFGLSNARSVASRAYMNLGHRDAYHLRMAERTFGPGVTFNVLDQHVARIRTVLNSLAVGQNLFGGTCDNPDCNTGTKNAVAVTLDDLSGVVLCPFYFLQSGRTLVTTFLHEAGHMANIDINWAPGNERYCRPDDVIECDNICPLTGENLLENVDAWARFIYCLSVSS